MADIQGLPPGAVLKPISGLPPGAVLKPISAPVAASAPPTAPGITPSMSLGMQALSQNPKTRGMSLASAQPPKPPSVPYSDPVNKTIIGLGAKAASAIPTSMSDVGNLYKSAADLGTGGAITAYERGKQYGQAPPTAGQIVGDARDDMARQFGADPDAIREAARNRDFSSLASESILPVLAAKGMASAAHMPPDAGVAVPGVKVPTGVGVRRALDRVVLGNEAPAQTLTRALKPPVTYPDFENVAAKRLPEIVNESNTSGQPITGVKSFTNTVDNLATKNDQAYRDLKSPFVPPTATQNGYSVRAAGPFRDVSIDGNPVADAQMRSIPATNLFEQPNQQQYIQRGSRGVLQGDAGIAQNTADTANLYRKPIPLGQADDIRVDTNAKLNSFYNKAGGDRFAALSNPETARVKAVNDSIRDGVYSKLQAETGVDPRPIQDAYGDFKDLGDVAAKRGTVYSRQQPIPLHEQINAADALASGNPLKFALAKMFSRYGNSDVLTRIAIDRANPYRPPSVQPLRVNQTNAAAGLSAGAGKNNR